MDTGWPVITTAKDVITFLMDMSAAGDDCKRLIKELYSATTTLEAIRSLAQTNPDKLHNLRSLLVPNGALEQFRQTVDDLSSRILLSRGVKNLNKRFRFVTGGEDIQKLLKTLERHQVTFILCLGLENM